MKKQKGFSLIELLIVVAIIGIIAAIAIPNLLAARRSANTASGLQTLRNLHSAEVVYLTSLGRGNFAPSIAALGGTDDTAAGFLDNTITAAETNAKSGYLLSGYTFVDATTMNPATYSVLNNPSNRSGFTRTGNNSFFVDESGVIRQSQNPNVDAGPTSEPIS